MSSALRNNIHSHSELKNIEELILHLDCIWEELNRVECQFESKVNHLELVWRRSAVNLLQYVELRKHDIRPLQESLANLGLSSLGRSEAHVMATLGAVLKALHQLADKPLRARFLQASQINFSEGAELIEAHSNALLGPPQQQRLVRIMVTMPAEAATDPRLVRDMVAAGMDCMRINCAHDDENAWEAMILNLRQAEKELGLHCRILMDLAGPKLRTGPIKASPVIKCRPQRDERGRILTPSRIWLYPDGNRGDRPVAGAHLPLDPEFIKGLVPGDKLRITDTRGAKRWLTIKETGEHGCWAECTSTVYFASGLDLQLERNGQNKTSKIRKLPAIDGYVSLKAGDSFILTASQSPGSPAVYDANGMIVEPATAPCTLPQVFAFVKAGESILFDDGIIRGKVTDVSPERLGVEITHTPPSGAKLRSDKGINLPQSNLDLPALTSEDLACIPFVTEHADLVGMSFVERPKDILDLQKIVRDLKGRQPGIVLKIETSRAFHALPALILAAMHCPCAGFMIARGDLAVECGFERMAEIQEEILWLCEAAHMPVIWATQVLESLAKSGQPSRAEITDAAMGERAECVMLNKGPHILAAMRALNDILQRMEGHQHKKQSLLRRLGSWGHAHEICASVSQAFDGAEKASGAQLRASDV